MKAAKGDRFGCLTVLGSAAPSTAYGMKKQRFAVMCDCGRKFLHSASNLKTSQKHCKACKPAPNPRGGFVAGENHPNAKLTDEDVMAIRAGSEISGCEWARRLGVHQSSVAAVRKGRTWTKT